MVGTPKSLVPTLPRGAVVDIFYVHGGRSQISNSDTFQGGAIDVFLR
jgi:hypothetical protein